MRAFFSAIHQGLGGLGRFSGRDPAGQFWLYVLFVSGLIFVATAAVILPPIAASMGRIQRFAAEHPDQVTVTSGPGRHEIIVHGHHPELMPNIQGIIQPMIFISAAAVALLAAAVVRRLHDRGRSGLWGVLPLPFLIGGFVLMPRLFRNFAQASEPDFGLFFALMANNLIYVLSLGILVILLVGAGTRGPNLYGPDPRGG